MEPPFGELLNAARSREEGVEVKAVVVQEVRAAIRSFKAKPPFGELPDAARCGQKGVKIEAVVKQKGGATIRVFPAKYSDMSRGLPCMASVTVRGGDTWNASDPEEAVEADLTSSELLPFNCSGGAVFVAFPPAPSDTTLDLATPLSRVLFDIQEIDTHIHNLTSSSALPLITHTQEQVASAERVLENVEAQVQALTEGYARLESDVVERYENAQEVRVAAENSLETLRLAKATGRYLMLGRQLEGQMGALSWSGRSTSGSGSPAGSPVPGSMGSREDHRALVDASYTLLQLRRLSSPIDENDEGYGLGRINVVRTLKTDLVTPAENTVKSKAQQIISRFSLASLSADAAAAAAATPQLGSATLSRSASPGPGGMTTFAQAEEARAKVASAISALYLLSPTPTGTAYIP
ncbi:hypothetical protein KEM55_002200, partial [Ascosphaera atra]